MTEYLTLDDVLAAAQAHLGHPPQVSDYGLLESALARPQAKAFGDEAYPGIQEKAAALLQSLATSRALVKGNKRTAFVATALFYELNGLHVAAWPEDELFELVTAVATQEIDSNHVIARRLAQLIG